MYQKFVAQDWIKIKSNTIIIQCLQRTSSMACLVDETQGLMKYFLLSYSYRFLHEVSFVYSTFWLVIHRINVEPVDGMMKSVSK